MCYDMSFFATVQQINVQLPLDDLPAFEWEPTWHQVAQSWHPFPVVLQEDGKRKLRYFEWGLIAPYMNTPEKIAEYRSSMANARSEKILHDARSVWHRIRHQRCLVCTTGFFEHRDVGARKKLPYFIRVKNQEVFFMAALYNYAPLPDADTGELAGTFAVVTRAGNELMKKIHNSGPNSGRMPLLLDGSRAEQWLNPDLSDAAMEQVLQYEFPATELEAWAVNTIRTRKADTAHILDPLPVTAIPPL